jgi:hypothetical protein
MKNRFINGAMVIDQRNAGASITPTTDATFTVDRWSARLSQASKYSVQQNAGSVTPPAGFTNYLGITSLSAYSVSSTDYFSINQPIEGYNIADLGWGSANAKTVTMSFWVRSSLTGTFGGSIFEYSGGNPTYPFSYSIPTANTWTQISITIAGPTTGTFNTTNNGGLNIGFAFGVGSSISGTAGAWTSTFARSATGAVSVVGTNGATFYITGVQFEVGSSATGYEYVNYQTSLANCQRYYTRFSNYGNQNQNQTLLVGVVSNSTTANICGAPFPVTMRAAPTTTYSGTPRAYDGGNAPNITGINIVGSSLTTAGVTFGASSGGLTNGRVALIIPSGGPNLDYVDFSAEL